jgi:hypothetical protein
MFRSVTFVNDAMLYLLRKCISSSVIFYQLTKFLWALMIQFVEAMSIFIYGMYAKFLLFVFFCHLHFTVMLRQKFPVQSSTFSSLGATLYLYHYVPLFINACPLEIL